MSTPEIPESAKRLTIGVLGGMGPQATVDFFHEVIARTPATRDQDHLRLLIDNNPAIPDRQDAMQGDDRLVRETLRGMALELERYGADFLVMPCNTAHAFIAEAVAAVRIPIVDIIEVTVDAVAEQVPEASTVGLLATDACIAAGNYERAAAKAGFSIRVPEAGDQAECMSLIAAVKGGDTGPGVRLRMERLGARFVARGLDALIAGCTEIPLVLEDDVDGVPLISSTDVLAQRAVDYALGRRVLPVHRG